jgi:RNA polymerase sigma-70 factor, ECF subfamily
MSTPMLCEAGKLVELLQAGDIEALDQVTRCYGDQLLSAARRHCRNEAQAADAVQDAMLTAWKYGEKYRGEGRVDRWLVRLVATACNRMRRGLKNRSALHVSDEELLKDDVSPELLVARSQLAEQLGEALLQLTPEDRTILILADAQGWKGPEIAEKLHLTPGAVRTRLSRAHARLRDYLQPIIGGD